MKEGGKEDIPRPWQKSDSRVVLNLARFKKKSAWRGGDVIGRTYVAEWRTARVILLIRREMDQVG